MSDKGWVSAVVYVTAGTAVSVDVAIPSVSIRAADGAAGTLFPLPVDEDYAGVADRFRDIAAACLAVESELRGRA